MVYDPATTLDPTLTSIKLSEWPAHFQSVISRAQDVHLSPCPTFRSVLFGVYYVTVCKTWFLSFDFYQLIFIITEVYNFMPVLSVELRFFVHVQNPCVGFNFVVCRALVQSTCFEQGVIRGILVCRAANLSCKFSSWA